MSKKHFTPPEANKGDKTHALIKGVISALPYLGGPAAELFAIVIAPPLQQRQIEWMNKVADCLNTMLKDRDGFEIKTLKDDPNFVSIVLHSTRLAIQNHQEEKLIALRNAVVNTALGIDINENLQQLFLEYIDSCTPLHLKLLAFFHNPKEFLTNEKILGMKSGVLDFYIKKGVPELRDPDLYWHPFADDLYNKGLIHTQSSNFDLTLLREDILSKKTTPLGDDFLKYITLE